MNPASGDRASAPAFRMTPSLTPNRANGSPAIVQFTGHDPFRSRIGFMRFLFLAAGLLSTALATTAAPARFVTALESGRPQHIVVFGTSLSKSGAWVPQLEHALATRFPGLVKITNGAKGGQSSEWGAAHVESNVIAHRPDAVFIEFAINDAVVRYGLSPAQVKANVDRILDRITSALPECEIIIQVMNPAIGHPPGHRSERRDQDTYQQIYRDAAKERGLLLIDHSITWNGLLRDAAEAGFNRYVPDGVHPNAAGYARFVLPAILQALGLPADRLPVRETDVLVYGGTAGGAMAAIQVARMGKRVLLLEPSRHLGGLTTGGLGATDAGHRYTVGGIAREFYRRVFDYYQKPDAWKSETRASYLPRHPLIYTEALQLQWFFEPHVASKILRDMLAEANVDVLLGAALDRQRGIQKENTRIVSFATTDLRQFRAQTYIDATYEGDLLAAAGASYRVGREPNSLYGETLNGIQLAPVERTAHVSPWREPGNPASGLLPRIRPSHGVNGEGDDQTQAFNFRLCLTDLPENRVPIAKPATYDPLNYEVILRHSLARPNLRLNHVYSLTPMPNRKTDTNNRVYFSTDYVGGSHRWAEASDAERIRLWREHRDYQLGLLWFLANDPRVPEKLRTEASHWGLARDEFVDTNHWPPALYVREARRLVSDYVLTELDCTGARSAPDPVTLGSYAMDSHVVNYVVDAEGRLRVDGWISKSSKPYGISFRTLLPRRSEVSNLLVSTCVSSSHVAYGSLRMEPVFMNLGQVAATTAVLALERNIPLHDLPYPTLRARLEADGQIFDAAAAKRALDLARKALRPPAS